MKLLIAIPAYNEEKSIATVIGMVREKTPQHEFVVMNDGSKDRTLSICRELNVPVLDLPVNLGLSGAFGCAMKYAWEKGFDAVIQIDADAQHDPGNIHILTELMEKTGCDVAIGSRFCEKPAPMNTLRGLGSRLITALIRLKTHAVVHDPTSGMRLYNRKVIELFAKNDFMEPEPHTIAYLLKNGYRVDEAYVQMYERETGQSYLTGLRVIRYMLHVCLSIILV